jgi:hypothetical protein
MVDQSSFVNNSTGLRGDGSGSITRISLTNVTGNATGTNHTAGAQLLSYSNNHIDGNTAEGPNPTPLAPK